MAKNKKKPIKAKNKKVKSSLRNKKKVSDSKVSIKKTRVNKKAIVKKNVRKKKDRKKKVGMDELYSIINKVQIGRKKVVFACDFVDAATIEHTIKDAEIKYTKVEMKTQVVFSLTPDNSTKYEDAILDQIEILEDEIPDDTQIFP